MSASFDRVPLEADPIPPDSPSRPSTESPENRRRWLTGAAWLIAAAAAQGASASLAGARLRTGASDEPATPTGGTVPPAEEPAVGEDVSSVRPKRPKTKLRGGSKPPAGGGGGKALDALDRPAVLVYRRLAFGHAPGDLERFEAGGATLDQRLSAWLDAQIQAPFRRPLGAANGSDSDPASALFLQRVTTRAQLREVLTAFWLDQDEFMKLRPSSRSADAAPSTRDISELRANAFGSLDVLAPGRPIWRVAQQLSRVLLGAPSTTVEAAATAAARSARGRSDQVAAMVRAIALHPEFLARPASTPRSPVELTIATVRALRLDPSTAVALPAVEAALSGLSASGLGALGDGVSGRTSSTHARLAAWAALETLVATAPESRLEASLDDWAHRLFGRPASIAERRILNPLFQVAGQSSIAGERAVAVGLLLSPAFQGR